MHMKWKKMTTAIVAESVESDKKVEGLYLEKEQQ